MPQHAESGDSNWTLNSAVSPCKQRGRRTIENGTQRPGNEGCNWWSRGAARHLHKDFSENISPFAIKSHSPESFSGFFHTIIRVVGVFHIVIKEKGKGQFWKTYMISEDAHMPNTVNRHCSFSPLSNSPYTILANSFVWTNVHNEDVLMLNSPSLALSIIYKTPLTIAFSTHHTM